MRRVYVQNKDGEPLMPTERFGAVRRWLRDGEAVVVTFCPFAIRMQRDCENNRQEVIVGLDTGAINVGCSAVSGNRVLYASETKLRTDISKKMQRRAAYRGNRRSNLRYREAKFDIQKLQNPEIHGKQYQQGITEGYDNIRAYVFERDSYTCQICKKGEGILQTHHINQRHDNGSNRPDNLVAVHKKCHEDFHKGLINHIFRNPQEYKAETQVTILKDYIVNELREEFDVNITFGHITKRNRQRLNLPKSHWSDAIAITHPNKVERTDNIFKRVCITQRRYQLTKGARSEKMLPDGEMFGFRQWDQVKVNDQIGFIKGRRTSGFFDVCDIDGNNISHSIKYTNLQRLCSNNVMEVIASPPTAKAVGVRSETIL